MGDCSSKPELGVDPDCRCDVGSASSKPPPSKIEGGAPALRPYNGVARRSDLLVVVAWAIVHPSPSWGSILIVVVMWARRRLNPHPLKSRVGRPRCARTTVWQDAVSCSLLWHGRLFIQARARGRS